MAELGEGIVSGATEHQDNTIRIVDVDKQDSLEGFIERNKDRHEAYARFHSEFQQEDDGELNTTVTDGDGLQYRIELLYKREKPEIATINLDEENPVQFQPTKYTVNFYRRKSATLDRTEIAVDEQTDSVINLNFDDLEELGLSSFHEVSNSDETPILDEKMQQEAMIKDLQKKFAELGLPQIPVVAYAHRLIAERQQFKAGTARAEADMMLSYYREIEIKRLLALEKATHDSHTPDYSLELVTQRQHLYNQLNHSLREAGMKPAQIAEYLIEGLFDVNHIAGIPVFTRGKDHYVLLDYTFAGYDEQAPQGTDFSKSYAARSEEEIMNIFDLAKKHRYKTYSDTSYVNGGTHQRWNWTGLLIDDFDDEHLDRNLPKVVKMLEDVGIDPKKAADVNNTSISDLFTQ